MLKVLECLLVLTSEADDPHLMRSRDVGKARKVLEAMRERRQSGLVSREAGGAKTNECVDGDRLMWLRNRDVRMEVERMLNAVGADVRSLWEDVLGDLVPEDCEDWMAFLEEWLVGVLGPVL